jgi:hypothetical protein
MQDAPIRSVLNVQMSGPEAIPHTLPFCFGTRIYTRDAEREGLYGTLP